MATQGQGSLYQGRGRMRLSFLLLPKSTGISALAVDCLADGGVILRLQLQFQVLHPLPR